MNTRPTSIACLIFACLFISADYANSQVVIYKLDFKKTGDSINFSFFEEGLLVVPALGCNAAKVAKVPQDFTISPAAR